MEDRPLCEWSDAEIRSTLLARGEKDIPVTPTTRPLLLSKLGRLLQKHPHTSNLVSEVGSEDEESTGTASQRQNSCKTPVHDDTGSGKQEERETEDAQFEGYYGVATGKVEFQAGVQLSPFYTNKSEALKAIRNIPGARFKKFESQEGAEAFSMLREITWHDKVQANVVVSVSEKPNNFPGLKTQDLTKFRKLIENGETSAFTDAVWSNPRHLITSGDAPEILQEGFRYNALHCAVRARQLSICRELFLVLQSDWFWKLVYQDDSEETHLQRRTHLIDLYLNMQDKINNETPLHFACKLGYEKIVSFLMTFPGINTTVRNKYGKTPDEIVCQSASSASTAVRERIVKLVRVDNAIPPHLGSPCTMEELELESPIRDETGTPVVGHALAGPMPSSKAEELYREWRSPSQGKERRAASQIKRSDPDRGLERVGRQLAHKKGVGWTEYWDFLGCSCDLSTPEGLQLLEQYLADMNPSFKLSPTAMEDTVHSPPLNTPVSGFTGNLFSPNSAQLASPQLIHSESPCGDTAGVGDENTKLLFDQADQKGPALEEFCTLKQKLTWEEGEMASLTKSFAGMGINQDTANSPSLDFTSTAQDHDKGMTGCVVSNKDTFQSDISVSEDSTTQRPQVSNEGPESTVTGSEGTSAGEVALSSAFVTPVRGGVHSRLKVFLSGTHPTKLDYDVLQALCDTTVDPDLFPHLHHWLLLVKAYPEQERKSWRTPASNRKHQSFFSHLPAHPISPLAFLSPPPRLSPAHLHRPTTPLHHTITTPNRVHPNISHRETTTPRH